MPTGNPVSPLPYNGSESCAELERRLEALTRSDSLVAQVYDVARLRGLSAYERMVTLAYFAIQRCQVVERIAQDFAASAPPPVVVISKDRLSEGLGFGPQ